MTVIIGLDTSLVSTGMARIATDNGGGWLAETWCRPSKPTPNPMLADRADRILGIVQDALMFALPCDLVVIEGPSFHSVSRSTVDRAWLWGAIISRLLSHETPVVEVPPTTRSKFIAASGGADKAAVAMAVARMWPDWEPGVAHGVNDQADALALASIGVVLADLVPPFPMPVYRTQALAKIRTPDLERT